jgi:hypothetical protein
MYDLVLVIYTKGNLYISTSLLNNNFIDIP